MPRRTYEEYTRVWWVPTVANMAAPTAAEIGAGTDISPYLPKDGLKVGSTNNRVRNDDITSAFNAEIPGSFGNAVNLTLFRDDDEDAAWALFQTRNVYGHLIVRRMVAVTAAVTAGQDVEVYPVATGQPVLHDTAENERVKFGVDLMVTGPPQLAAAVAG
jgi:hypothetical protein